MKHTSSPDFSVNKEAHSITIKREFRADLPQVWDAFTKKEILDQWWGPRPWKARTKTMDFREGGRWHYAMVGPEGEEHWAFAKYTSIKDNSFFTADDGFCDAEGTPNAALPQSEWRCIFKEVPDGTLVLFQITFSDAAQLDATLQMGFQEGLKAAMEGLDEIFAASSKSIHHEEG